PSAGPAPARPARPTAAPSTVQRRHMAHRTSGSRTVRAISARIEDYEVILFTHDHALRLVVSHGDACLPALSAPVSGTSRRLQGQGNADAGEQQRGRTRTRDLAFGAAQLCAVKRPGCHVGSSRGGVTQVSQGERWIHRVAQAGAVPARSLAPGGALTLPMGIF